MMIFQAVVLQLILKVSNLILILVAPYRATLKILDNLIIVFILIIMKFIKLTVLLLA
jgi:hypothetical protein